VWRLASDIGGTFTDLVYFNETTGDLGTAKSLTTPRELTQGVIDTIRLSQIDPGEVGFFVHGGTTVINVITERKGAKTALITTAGFRDVLEIARGNRPDLYNLRFEKEPPIVRRRYRFEVRERVDAGQGTRAAPSRGPRPDNRAMPQRGYRGHRYPVPAQLRSSGA
jgi:N-methylhydantoinase A